jgi:hypothetical protein
MGDCIMTFATFSRAVVIAMALCAAAPAFAQEDECDAIVTALKQYGDTVMKSDPKTTPGQCVALGQILGLARAMREVADQCMDEGAKRDALVKEMSEGVKPLQEHADQLCK